jgi:lipopolysaccharide heptosyltransferase II
MSSSRQRIRLGLLRGFASLTRPFRRTPQEFPEAPRFLLIRPDHIGDLLFFTPALRALREAFPHAHLSCMIGPWGKAVLENNPHLDEIITCDFPGFSRKPKDSSLAPYRALRIWRRRLASGGYDAAIVLRFDHWWGALLAYLAGIPYRIGYAIPECQPFLSHALPYDHDRHEVQQNLTLVHEAIRQAGLSSPDGPPALEYAVSQQDQEYARTFLVSGGVKATDNVVVIHPGAGAPVKLWRPEALAEVADALRERHHTHILITGGPDDLDLAWSVYAHMRSDALVAAGKTTLGQLAALLQLAQLAIGPDSGPLHLAVAVGTPTVHLYGPVDARKFGPAGDPGKHMVLTSGRQCIPCNRLDYAIRELPEHPCVREISVQQVLESAHRLLALPAREVPS